MKKRKLIYVAIMFLFTISFTLTSCSKLIKPTVIDQTGRQIPSPHYVLYSTQDKISATFYYAMLAGKRDLDGTIQVKPTFLNMNKRYEFNSKLPIDVILVIEISNPKEIEYHLWESVERLDSKGKKIFEGALLTKSNLRYRQYNFKLPTYVKWKEVQFAINLEDKDGHMLIRFGDFHYEIK